jgi:hypothetical protein
MRIGRLSALGLVALCAAIVIVPTAAVGKATQYIGPVDLPPHPSEPDVQIRFKVRYDKKGKPEELFPLEVKGIRLQCENGSTIGIGGGYGGGFALFGEESVLVKKRRFSSVQRLGNANEDTWTINGTIPKNGDASGTLRIQEAIGPGDEDLAHYGTCDTGTAGWTASKQG